MITDLNVEHYMIMGFQFANFIMLLLIFRFLGSRRREVKDDE